MTTIGIIGAGHIGSQIARAATRHGYDVVISNSRGPESLAGLVAELGPKARAATAAEATAAFERSRDDQPGSDRRPTRSDLDAKANAEAADDAVRRARLDLVGGAGTVQVGSV